MFIHIELKIIAIGVNNFIAGDNGYAIHCHFFLIVRIFPLIYTHPEYDTAFSSTSDFGLANADHSVIALILKKFMELLGDFGQNFYIKH